MSPDYKSRYLELWVDGKIAVKISFLLISYVQIIYGNVSALNLLSDLGESIIFHFYSNDISETADQIILSKVIYWNWAFLTLPLW